MDKVFQSPVDPFPPATPRFSLGRVAGGGLAACLWLWTSTGALTGATVVPAPESAASVYRQAQECFGRQDYARALTLLEHAPAIGSASERADLANLRGAIYLRQHRFDQAHQEFTHATELDPGLWAARFNVAEVSFRQKQYAGSRREFEALLGHTSRLLHPEEHRFLQYKMALADLCDGQEKPALDFIAEHRSDERPPAAWYYLNAAIEQRHNRPQKVTQWLAQADTAPALAAAGHLYAESFARLGWTADRTDRTALAATARQRSRRESAVEPTAVAKAGASHPAGKSEPDSVSIEPSRAPATTMAMVQLMPAVEATPVDKSPTREDGSVGASRSNFRSGMPPAPTDLSALGNLPPSGDDFRANVAEALRSGRSVTDAVPTTLRKPSSGRKASPAPTPSPSPSASVAPSPTDSAGAPPASDPDAKAEASPGAAPVATPSPEFAQKYEAALVKFLEKDFLAATDLLDQADKAQQNQPQSANLRTQIFKAYYGAAYLAFRKADYPAALEQLDGADRVQTVADSFNLRGLVQSKQRNYDQAEAMFKKAFTVDPTLWASRFNYAELPFNYGNYTMARSRFENLLDQTSKSNQPREVELTQYKIFLTLLMEGKVDAASNFRDHLNFSGATPARFFCQAALDFHEGNVEKAKNWIDSAKKDFQPQLVSIFIESFYRLGWMSDPNAVLPGTAIAAASPGASPAASPGASPAASPGATPVGTALALALPSVAGVFPAAVATGSASPSPAAVALAKGTPSPASLPTATATVFAKASPTPLPLGTPAVAAASPSPLAVQPTPAPSLSPAAASASPAVAAVTPRPVPSTTVPAATPVLVKPSPALVAASATPLPTAVASVPLPSPTLAIPSPALVKASATPLPIPSATMSVASPVPASPTPIPALAKASATPLPTAAPTASASPVMTHPALAAVPTVTPAATPAPTPTPDASPTAAAQPGDNVIRLSTVGIALFTVLFNLYRMRRAVARQKSARRRRAARRRVAETAQ